MNLPQFSLRWNNYVNHVTGAFNVLRLDNDLVDVTLCCEGGQIKAHRVVLSACSAYFKQIFKENPCQHPVIIFRNVKFEDLNGLVNFMYHGEINIFQEQLESFLITAELLQIKGLTDNVDEQSNSKVGDSFSLDFGGKRNFVEEPLPSTSDTPINLATVPTNIEESNSSSIYTPMTSQVDNNDVKNQSDLKTERNTSETTNQIKINSSEEDMNVDTEIPEDLSDKNANESDLLKFWCQLCPKGFKHPTSLTLHKDSHAGKTQCPVCRRSFSRSYDMRSHLQRIHQGKQLTIKEIKYKFSNVAVSTKPFTQNS